jgi:hypothetical protein
MPIEDFEYDVAFSFLKEDEGLATELNDLFDGRLTTFLYSKRQGELAGGDGEASFTEAFGKKSRLVVVLFRSGWGETPWTRIEQTALRNRAFESGYDFTLFIKLDSASPIPAWIPKTQIWYDYTRWGAKGAVIVIEGKARTLGSEPKTPTPEDRAQALIKERQFKKSREAFLGSDRGVAASDISANEIFNFIETLVATDHIKKLGWKIKRGKREFILVGHRASLRIHWHRHYVNTLDGAELTCSMWDGHPPWPGVVFLENPRQLSSRTHTFEIDVNDRVFWLDSKGSQFDSQKLSNDLLIWLMDYESASKKG